ncbi:MAG: PTS sugar transporter subunit IIA [Anaerostipes hadrus]
MKFLHFLTLWNYVLQIPKLSLLLLDTPIKWNESNSIQIVFMLVIKQGEMQDFEHLYDIFIEIINDNKLEQKIIDSRTYDEFINVLL